MLQITWPDQNVFQTCLTYHILFLSVADSDEWRSVKDLEEDGELQSLLDYKVHRADEETTVIHIDDTKDEDYSVHEWIASDTVYNLNQIR